MSVVEDVRKAIQDLVAPDLKALDTTVRALDAAVKEGFAATEKLATVRHELILAELKTFQAIENARYESIMKALDVDRRLERLEAKQSTRTAEM